MAVTQNLKGTSYPSFKIHKKGPTFYQGDVAPTFPATNGDMYIQHGTGGAAWVYNEGWKILETGANDAVDVFEIYNSVRTSSKQVMYVLQGETTDATETELSPESTFSIDTTSLTLDNIGTTSDSGSSVGKISIPEDSTGLIEARIVARNTNSNKNAGYVIKGVIVNDGGTTVMLTDPAEEIIGEDTSEWYALIEAADNGTDSLRVKVSGSADTTVRWTAFVTITFVTQERTLLVTSESGTAFDVAQGDTLLISTTTLLANDVGAPGDTLTITGVQNAVGGTVTLVGDTIQFVSDGLAGAPASFEYVVSNGSATATGTVTINVTKLNDIEAYMFNLAADAAEARTLPEYIPPSVAEIFNTWARFDGANYYEGDDPNKSSNASAWQLLSNPTRVNMPLNVDPSNGFISPDSLENFTFEATLQSIDSDNDSNGLIVAFVREGSVNHVLALMASKGGSTPRSGYGLVYFQNTSGYSDEPTILAQPDFGLDINGGWSNSQIRLKIQRSGNTVKCYATQFNNTGTYDANSEIVFDLNSNANTQRFMGAKPYGYMTFSQPDSAYVDIAVNGGLDKEVIFDAENNEVWDWSDANTAWELSTDTAQDRLSYVRQVTNPNTTERFRVRELEIEYLGKSENAVFDATRAATEIQNIYINSTTGGTGVGSGIEVIGLFEYDVEERNLLLDKPTLTTTSAYNNGNSVGSGTYFSDNSIDISSLSLVDGTVVFADGTVGVITAITDSSISYTVTTDFTIFDETIEQPAEEAPTGDWSAATLTHTLDNPNDYSTSAGDRFGTAVDISGNYAIVGAEHENDVGGQASGKAYIFNATTGALLHTLDNPNGYDTSAGDFFGNSVAISGNYAIVGADGEDDAGGTTSGKAYIFNVTTGALLHTLDNPNPYGTSENDYFGARVEIDGDYAIVSAYVEDDAGGDNSGKAYIYNVTTGALVHTLDNPNAYDTSAGDAFGTGLSISGDRAIVGAYSEDDAGGTSSGKAYIFNVTTGALVHTLDNPYGYGTSDNDRFGIRSAISGDRAIVGAWWDDYAGGIRSGKAYIYDVTTGALLHTLDNPNPYGTSENDWFGSSVAISGNYAVVGAYQEDDAGGTESGKAYIFDVSTGALVKTLDNPNAYGTSAGDKFGFSVSISGNQVIVGTDGEDDAGGATSGKAYIFTAG